MKNKRSINNSMKKAAGFTLLELTVVLSLFAVFILYVVSRGDATEAKQDAQNLVTFMKDAKVDLRQVVPEEAAGCTTANVTAGAFVEAYKVDITSGGATTTLIKPDKKTIVEFAPNAGNTACVISLTNIDEDRCPVYLKELWPSNDQLTVNTTEVKADDSVTYLSAAAAIKTACSNATNSISTEYAG